MSKRKKSRADFEPNYVGEMIKIDWEDVLHLEGDTTLME